MKHDEHLWNQYCRLGEMMGDGLHYEEPWIAKEYKRLAKILMPETYLEANKWKKVLINKAVQNRLQSDKCPKCNSEMKQVRSGSYVVKCNNCGTKGKYKTMKTKNRG